MVRLLVVKLFFMYDESVLSYNNIIDDQDN